MLIYIPRIQIANIPLVWLQLIGIIIVSYTIYLLKNQPYLKLSITHIILLMINPLTLHYLWYAPYFYILFHLAIISCIKNPYQGIAIGILIAIHPQFIPILSSFNKNEIMRSIIVCSCMFLIGYLCNSIIVMNPEMQYPSYPSLSQPSINLIWLLQSHMFNNFQYLYSIFLIMIPILSYLPLSYLPLNDLLKSTVGLFLAIYTLQYCPIGWHLVLGLMLLLNYQRSKFFKIVKNELNEKIQSILGLIFSVGPLCFSFFIHQIINRWRQTYQLNTGHILLFMVILWLMNAIYIVQLVEQEMKTKCQQSINTSIEDNNSIIKKIKDYFIRRYHQM